MSEKENWKELKKQCYGKKRVTMFGDGFINFDRDSAKNVNNGSFKSYNEYLDVQRESCGKNRKYFGLCLYNAVEYSFKGEVEHVDLKKGKVVFHRIMINGIYEDGTGFFGKEDHVWMDLEPFGDCASGDCFSFEADICCYMKQRDGKLIDYDLRNPRNVKKLDGYHVPTDEDLVDQQIRQIVCETCLFGDHCDMFMCQASKEDVEHRVEVLKSLQPGKFTPFTVMLAYELEYRVMLQTRIPALPPKSSPLYPVLKKFLEICASEPVYYTKDVDEAMAKMFMMEKPRMYIE